MIEILYRFPKDIKIIEGENDNVVIIVPRYREKLNLCEEV